MWMETPKIPTAVRLGVKRTVSQRTPLPLQLPDQQGVHTPSVISITEQFFDRCLLRDYILELIMALMNINTCMTPHRPGPIKRLSAQTRSYTQGICWRRNSFCALSFCARTCLLSSKVGFVCVLWNQYCHWLFILIYLRFVDGAWSGLWNLQSVEFFFLAIVTFQGTFLCLACKPSPGQQAAGFCCRKQIPQLGERWCQFELVICWAISPQLARDGTLHVETRNTFTTD